MLGKMAVFCLAALFAAGSVAPAVASPAGPLAQVIEGAKKEGTATVKLHSSFTEKSMYRLEKGIKDKYGVDLKIKFLPVLQFPKALAEVMMEQKAGIAPSVDLLTITSDLPTASEAGALEVVDWKPLLGQETSPRAVLEGNLVRGGIVYYTGHYGLMYNPEKIKSDEVPRTWESLTDPKWKGKGGIPNNLNSYIRWAFLLGKEKVLPSTRLILQNGAIQGNYPNLLNRYLIGEIWWCTITSSFMRNAQAKGMPAAWQSLDFSDISDFASIVVKGASHPNAAKLVALYLAGPEGAKFTLEEAGAGNAYYPGNYEHDISVQDQKQGIQEVFNIRDEKILKFYTTKEARAMEKEVRLILQTGGKR